MHHRVSHGWFGFTYAIDRKMLVCHRYAKLRRWCGDAESDREPRVRLLVLTNDTRNIDRRLLEASLALPPPISSLINLIVQFIICRLRIFCIEFCLQWFFALLLMFRRFF